MYAVIRIRGTVNVGPKIKRALEHLNLRRINNLSLWAVDKKTEGMLNIVKDYATYGKINDETLKELISKRARPVVAGAKIDAKKAVEELKKGKTLAQVGIKNCFTLSPPAGGFERKGVKAPYSLGGALGNRKEEISEMIVKMI